MKTLTHSFFLFVCLSLGAQAYAQVRRNVEVDGINYTILREADESETFGLASVAPKKKGKYFGDIVIPSGFQETDEAYAD